MARRKHHGGKKKLKVHGAHLGMKHGHKGKRGRKRGRRK